MSFSENAAHRANVLAAEAARQAAIASIVVGGNSATTTMFGGIPINSAALATRAADIAYNRACLASALANGLSPAPFVTALQALGTGGA